MESRIENCEATKWETCCRCYHFDFCDKKELNREFAGCSPVVLGVMALIISMFFIYFFNGGTNGKENFNNCCY